jgi:hypothetical protein
VKKKKNRKEGKEGAAALSGHLFTVKKHLLSFS